MEQHVKVEQVLASTITLRVARLTSEKTRCEYRSGCNDESHQSPANDEVRLVLVPYHYGADSKVLAAG